MRISDWSSDVCSSDLIARQCIPVDEHSLGDREGERRIRVAIDAAQRIGCYRQRARGDGERGRIGRILREAEAVIAAVAGQPAAGHRSEEHTSELQSLMRISYAVFCLKKKKQYTSNKEI